MRILSHRGYWKTPVEKNSWPAFERTLAHGFGTETDVRDLDGTLVISHDPARSGAIELDALLDRFVAAGVNDLTLAVNVKADGLAVHLARAFAGRELDWFVFDMSFPDLREQLRVGNPVFVRVSEHEPLPDPLVGELRGVWLDSFDGDWFGSDDVSRLLDRGLQVCIVSPELHRREHRVQWERLASLAGTPGVALCTDLPELAREFFPVELIDNGPFTIAA